MYDHLGDNLFKVFVAIEQFTLIEEPHAVTKGIDLDVLECSIELVNELVEHEFITILLVQYSRNTYVEELCIFICHPDEVDALMNLIVVAIERETPDLIKNNVRLSMIGDSSRMPEFAVNRLNACIKDTSHCNGLNLVLALSYSSRQELVSAVKSIAEQAKNGTLSIDDINEEAISKSLYTSNMPDPDLLIRTAGDLRISNYLLWQIAYAELYFTDKFWPDFSKDDFCQAIIDFQSRERRFGKTSEQISK